MLDTYVVMGKETKVRPT